MKQFILIRGVPGSGKTTLARQILTSAGLEIEPNHFEADMFFEDLTTGEYRFDASKLRRAHGACQYLAAARLSEIGDNGIVIVSNTFTKLSELEPYFKIAAVNEVRPQVLLAQGRYGNIHNVPADKVAAMRARFQFDITPLFNKYFPN